MIKLSLVLDREMSRREFEVLCSDAIRKVCSFRGDKYAPEIMIDSVDLKTMEIVPR